MTLSVKHEIIGGIIGLAFGLWLYLLGFKIIFAGGCFLIALMGASLPDILDPPDNPFTRGVGHNFISLVMFGLISLVGLIISIIINQWSIIMATAFSMAVLSHLIIDLASPNGASMFVGKSIWGIILVPLYIIPGINVVMLIVTIYMAMVSISYLAKKIGGIWSMILLFIPIWGGLLLIGIELLTFESTFWIVLGWVSLFFFVIAIVVLILIGLAVDLAIQNSAKIADVVWSKLDRFGWFT